MSRERRKFYLDKQNGKISGVCAGIAAHFDWDVTIVRVLFVTVCILTGFWPMMIGYAVAAWMIDNKPSDGRYESMRSSIDEARHEAAFRRPASWRFTDVKTRFDRVEDRLRTLENVVTSREFQMDRELRGLGRV